MKLFEMLSYIFFCCSSMCAFVDDEQRLFESLDKKDARSCWGSEHRIGVEMIKMGYYKEALQALRRAYVILPGNRKSYYDLMNCYYQMFCTFLLEDYEETIKLGEYIGGSIPKGKISTYPSYGYVLTMLFFSYVNKKNNNKKSEVFNRISMLSPLLAGKIHEIENIKNMSTIDLSKTLSSIGESEARDVASLLENFSSNILIEVLFPEYSFYRKRNYVMSAVFAAIDIGAIVISASAFDDIPGKMQFLCTMGAIRFISTIRAIQLSKDMFEKVRTKAIDTILDKKNINPRDLIRV